MIRLPYLARPSAALLGVATLLASVNSRAEVPFKGLIGGGLLGAELVTGTESLIGVRQPWIFAVSGAAGAAGGAVGGYFLERASSPRVALLTLLGGMALVIPATILTANAMSGSDRDEFEPSPVPQTEPAADPADPSASRELGLARPAPLPLGAALVWFQADSWQARVPDVRVSNAFTRRELQQFSVSQTPEFGVTLLGGRF